MSIVLLALFVILLLAGMFRDSLVDFFARPEGPEPVPSPERSIARNRPAWTSGPSVYEDAWVVGQDLEGCHWGDLCVSADALYFFPVGRLIDTAERNDARYGRVAGYEALGIAGMVIGEALGNIADASKAWKLVPGPQLESHVLDSGNIPENLDHAEWERTLRRLHLSRAGLTHRSSRFTKSDISSMTVAEDGSVSVVYGLSSLSYGIKLASGATTDKLREELSAHEYRL